jgi:hypothetical protein
MRKPILALLGLLLLVGQGFAVRAQNGATARLSLVDAQGFPTVSALLDVFDAEGQPITGLQPEDITIMEDGQPFPVSGLSESTPPVQIVVAINPGPAFAVRDGQGIERFKYITDMLSGWAGVQTLADNPDDLSLVTITGPIITHAKPEDWIVSLTSFQPDFRSTTPNAQSLTIALNTVNEETSQPGMKRAILLITTRMDDPNIDLTLNAFAEQAIASGVQIFVWYVDADLYFNTPSAIAFEALALQTGGKYFAFSGLETLPDPEMYFAPLRHLYSLSYNSTQTTSGRHTLAVEVQTPAGQIISEDEQFNLDVQPPNPILIMPPEQVVRQASPDDVFESEHLLPEEQQIEIIIEFPDNHPRPLARTTLYVDSQPAAQNDAEPFDRFIWDLSTYNESAQHELVVEVVDSLGMSKTSMGIPVTITVVHAPTGGQAFLARYRTHIALGAVALAGIILTIVLLSGRMRIKSRQERRESLWRKTDPVTQPVPIKQTEPPVKQKGFRKGKQAARLPWMRADRLKNAPAYFTRLGTNGEPLTGHPIPLLEKETTFGTDPIQSAYVLDHPSIAALHARLERTDSGNFLITDNGSVAGTWVNYDPVPKEGYTLKHGDVVHFGQLTYRFSLRKPPTDPEPKIIPEATTE